MINDITNQLSSLIEDNQYEITVLANTSAFLHMLLEDVSWTGFYLYKDDALILGPFQGKTACTYISLNKGVCGKCASKQETLIVANVHEFEGHIACDSESNSEIVVPLMLDDELYGVLDIDSKSYQRFTFTDKQLLESCCKVLMDKIRRLKKHSF